MQECSFSFTVVRSIGSLCMVSAICTQAAPFLLNSHISDNNAHLCAHFTLADPTPRLASGVVGGKSGRNLPRSRRDPIHIGRMAHNAYNTVTSVGTVSVQ